MDELAKQAQMEGFSRKAFQGVRPEFRQAPPGLLFGESFPARMEALQSFLWFQMLDVMPWNGHGWMSAPSAAGPAREALAGSRSGSTSPRSTASLPGREPAGAQGGAGRGQKWISASIWRHEVLRFWANGESRGASTFFTPNLLFQYA